MKKTFLLMLICVVCANAWAVVELVDQNYALELYAEYDISGVGTGREIAIEPEGNIFVTHYVNNTDYIGSIVKVDPDGNSSVFIDGLTRPTGIIWAGGTDYGDYLYITEGLGNDYFLSGGVTQIGLDGTVTRFTGRDVGLNQPVSIGIDRTGNYGGSMFVGNGAHDDIDRVSTTGQVTAFSPFPYNLTGSLTCIAFDTTGNYGGEMFVCAQSTNVDPLEGLYSLDTAGNPTRFVEDFDSAFSVAFDDTEGSVLGGLMYASAHKPGIQKLHLFSVNPDGSSTMIVKTDENRTWLALKMIASADGALYMLHNNAANNTVQIYKMTSPSVVLAYPNGGDKLLSGSTVPIQWNTRGDIDDVMIECSMDNGTTWSEVTPPNTGNTGTYEWTVPSVGSNQYLIRIIDSSNPENFDISADTFAVYQCYRPVVGDVDGDCIVGLTELAMLAENWLNRSRILIKDYPLDNDLSWMTEGQWEFGSPLGFGGDFYGLPDPDSGYTGTNVYGVNLGGDYDTTIGGPHYLTAGPIDCRHFDNFTVSFMSWLNSDSSNFVQCTFEVSENNEDWVVLWNNASEPISDDQWHTMEYDINQYAVDNDTLYLRWGYQIVERAYPYSGWNIDDVRIWSNP